MHNEKNRQVKMCQLFFNICIFLVGFYCNILTDNRELSVDWEDIIIELY